MDLEANPALSAEYKALYLGRDRHTNPQLHPPHEALETHPANLDDLLLLEQLELYGQGGPGGAMSQEQTEALLRLQLAEQQSRIQGEDPESLPQSNLGTWASNSPPFDLNLQDYTQDLSPHVGSPVTSSSLLPGEANGLALGSLRGQDDLGAYSSSPYDSNPMMQSLGWRQSANASLNGPFSQFGSASGNLGSRMGLTSPLTQRSASFSSTAAHRSHSLSGDSVLQKFSSGAMGSPSMPLGSPTVPIPSHHARSPSMPSVQKDMKLPLGSHSGRLLGPSKLRINSVCEQRPDSPPCFDPRMEASAPPTPTHLPHHLPHQPHSRANNEAMARALQHALPLPVPPFPDADSHSHSHTSSLTNSPRPAMLSLRSSEPTGLRSRLSQQSQAHTPALAQDFLRLDHHEEDLEEDLEGEEEGMQPPMLGRQHSRGHATGPNSPAATLHGGANPAFGRAPGSSNGSSIDAGAGGMAAQRGAAALYMGDGGSAAHSGGLGASLSTGLPPGSLPLSSHGMPTPGSSFGSGGSSLAGPHPPAFPAPASMPFPPAFGANPFGPGPAGILPGMAPTSMPLHATNPAAAAAAAAAAAGSSGFLPYDTPTMGGMGGMGDIMAAASAPAMAHGGALLPHAAMPAMYPAPTNPHLLSPEEYALYYRKHMEAVQWNALHGTDGYVPKGPGMRAGAGGFSPLPGSGAFPGGMGPPMMPPPPPWEAAAAATGMPAAMHPALMAADRRGSMGAGKPPYGARVPTHKGAHHEHARKGTRGSSAGDREDADYYAGPPPQRHSYRGGVNANGVALGHHPLHHGHGSRSGRRRDDAMHGGHGQPLSLLEEFKANKAHRFEFRDILGHVHEFSLDQHGSRFIQQKLEVVSSDELETALAEVLPQATSLITDVFGNYVMQKFLEHGSREVRERIAGVLKGQVLSLSLQMYGCRVMQKALEVLEVDTQCSLIAELDGNIMRCVRDQNGNHVIQKIIECVPTERITGLIDNFLTCVVPLSTHPFGCRVIQRVLEHCHDLDRKAVVMSEILKETCHLTKDQYGNYVIQHVLERGRDAEREQIIHTLAPFVVSMSMHKFASNVMEKCLAHGTTQDRDLMVNYMLTYQEPSTDGDSSAEGSRLGARPSVASTGSASGDEEARRAVVEEPLQVMMKDQYGNYVVQKVLEVCDDTQREQLLQRVRAQLCTLKKYTYGKHIVARMEKLLSAGAKIQNHLRARPLPDDLLPLNVRVSSPPISLSVSSPPAGPQDQQQQQQPQQAAPREQASVDSTNSSARASTPAGAAAAEHAVSMPLSAPSMSSCNQGSASGEAASQDPHSSKLPDRASAPDANRPSLSREDELNATQSAPHPANGAPAAPQPPPAAPRPMPPTANKGADGGLPLTDSSSLNMAVTK